jgi:hypothetical protein
VRRSLHRSLLLLLNRGLCCALRVSCGGAGLWLLEEAAKIDKKKGKGGRGGKREEREGVWAERWQHAQRTGVSVVCPLPCPSRSQSPSSAAANPGGKQTERAEANKPNQSRTNLDSLNLCMQNKHSASTLFIFIRVMPVYRCVGCGVGGGTRKGASKQQQQATPEAEEESRQRSEGKGKQSVGGCVRAGDRGYHRCS